MAFSIPTKEDYELIGFDVNGAVIFDVDGTISDCEHRRGFVTEGNKDWEAFTNPRNVLKDEPIAPIVFMLKVLRKAGARIIIVTGRSECDRLVTEAWLRLHCIPYRREDLYMRKDNDNRPDHVVKREILTKEINPSANVLWVFDDRNSVVNMWREAGLTCLQVAPGDF